MSGMPHGGWRKMKVIFREVVAELNNNYPHMTRNWKKMHPKEYKRNWKA